jgi:hypothetical protein
MADNDAEPRLTAERVAELAAEYEREEPFDTVEREQIETLPGALADGQFGWRDAEWVVRWYHRRPGRGVPDDERTAAETRFGENEYEAVADAIAAAVAASDAEAKLDALTELSGVDVPVGSAFLAFLHPERYVAVDEEVWAALRAADELSDPYPDPVTTAAYRSYVETVRDIAHRTGTAPWTVYRALCRLG